MLWPVDAVVELVGQGVHALIPVVGAYVPMEHAIQTVTPAAENVPMAHGWHAVAPARAYDPAGQVAHAVIPPDAAMDPAAHVAHALRPAEPVYLPATQVPHTALAVLVYAVWMKLPALQTVAAVHALALTVVE